MLIQNISNLPPGLQSEPKVNVRTAGSESSVHIAQRSTNAQAESAPTATTPQLAQAQQPKVEQLNRALNTINRALKQSNQNLQFSIDSTTDKLIVRVVDTSTGELIRQVPSDAALAIAQSIDQFQESHKIELGALLKQKA